jgi:hypothetical protein
MLAHRRVATTRPDPDEVLTKAVLRAAARLEVSQRDLGAILGLSPASISRVGSGTRRLDASAKEGELAIVFLRVYRSLDAVVGGDDRKARRWLDADNTHLGGVPRALLERVDGLVHVAEYLDAIRGRG